MHRVLRSLLLVSLLHGTTWASGADPAAPSAAGADLIRSAGNFR